MGTRFASAAPGLRRTLFVCLAAVMIANAASANAPDPGPTTLDDQFSAVAAQVPAFGGMFWSAGRETLEVVLTQPDAATTAAAAAAIDQVFGAGAIPKGGVVARPGQFSFAQLREWYGLVTSHILLLPGVVATDIHESSNRLLVAVAAKRFRAPIEAAIAGLEIPEAAIGVVVSGPVTPLGHTLQSAQSPRKGGYQITRLLNPQGIAACTLGWNVLTREGGNRGFVTNSHCSNVEWGLDSPPAAYYQAPGFFPNQLIGHEAFDPPGAPCGVGYPVIATCRWSDSLFANYIPSAPSDLGMIGRPTALTAVGQSMTPITLSVSHTFSFNNVGPGRFGIISGPTLPYLIGLPLAKVGRTTGWTQGTLEYAFFPSTCTDFNKSGNRVLRCQYVVGNQTDSDPSNDQWRIASFGDSGSPVFRIRNAPKKWVELYGILWGGMLFNNSSGSKKWVFSPIGGAVNQQSGVATDLGTLIYAPACLPPTLGC